MQELINKDYKSAFILTYLEVYDISNDSIESSKIEEQYFRALDSRGQHLINVEYSVTVDKYV